MKNNRRQLIVVFLVGFLPIAVAYLFYTGYLNVGGAKKNKGILISPPIIFSFLPDDHPWLWVYFGGRDCHQVCQNRLAAMARAHLALGKHFQKVNRVYASTQKLSEKTNLFLKQTDPQLKQVIVQIDQLKQAIAPVELDEGFIFLVSPDNYLVLYYDQSHTVGTILKDSKFLLKSQ